MRGEGLVGGGMKGPGALRGTWPSGLRALFWASAAGLVIEAAQFYLFGIVNGELGPPPSLQGMSVLVGLVLGIVMVASGYWAKRRPFVPGPAVGIWVEPPSHPHRRVQRQPQP